MGFLGCWFFLHFKFLMKIIQTFLFETDFYEQVRHKLSLIYKKRIVKYRTQLIIFKKEIKSTLNQ